MREAIEVLRGNLAGDFAELCIELAAQMIVVGGLTDDLDEARNRAIAAIQSGEALEKFRAVVKAQGGDSSMLDFSLGLEPGRWTPYTKYSSIIRSNSSGYVFSIQTDEIGRIVMDLGGGRKRLADPIDYAVGLYIHAKLGDQIKPGDPLVTMYFNDQAKGEEMTARILKAYEICAEAPTLEPLIKEII